LTESGLCLSLSPLPEQTQIATFLDRKTAAIDALIEKKQRLIALLEEKRQAVISRAVTRGLDPNVKMKDSGIPWLGEIPAHWAVLPIKHVCKLETGHTPSKSNPQFWKEDECTLPWISLNDTKTLESNDYIHETTVKISEIGMAHSSAHLLPPHAVVFNRDGARVGLAAITTKLMAVSQHIIAWVCGPRILPEFLLHVIYAMEDEIYRVAVGSTIPTIGMNDVKAMITPLPSLEEQKLIVDHVIAKRKQFYSATTMVHSQIERLKEYRQALITAAVTGKINVDNEEKQGA